MLEIGKPGDKPPLHYDSQSLAMANSSDLSFKDRILNVATSVRKELFFAYPNIATMSPLLPLVAIPPLDLSSLLSFRSNESISPSTKAKVQSLLDTYIEQATMPELDRLADLNAMAQPFDQQKINRIRDWNVQIAKSLYLKIDGEDVLDSAEKVISLPLHLGLIASPDVLLDCHNSPVTRTDEKVLVEKLHGYYTVTSNCIDLINLLLAPDVADRATRLEDFLSTRMANLQGSTKFIETEHRIEKLQSLSPDDAIELWSTYVELYTARCKLDNQEVSRKVNRLGDLITAVVEHFIQRADTYVDADIDSDILNRGLSCLICCLQNMAAFHSTVVNGNNLSIQLMETKRLLTARSMKLSSDINQLLSSPENVAGTEMIQYQGSAFHEILSNKFTTFDWEGDDITAAFFNDKLKLPELIKKFTGMNVEVRLLPDMGIPYIGAQSPPLNVNHPYIRNKHKYFFTNHYLGDIVKYDGSKKMSTVNLKTGQVSGWYSEVPFQIYITPMFYWHGWSAREFTAIFLHEIGHCFMFLAMMNRQMANLNVMDGLVRRLAGVKDKFERRDMISYDLNKLGIEVTDPDRLTSDEYNGSNSDVLACALFIDGSMNHTHVTEEKYSHRINEQLADAFAIAHGAGADLAMGVTKYEQNYGSNPALWSGKVMYCVSQVFQLLFVMFPPMWPVLLLASYQDSQGDDVYDEPLKRIELMRRSIIAEIKQYRNDPRMAKKLAEDADRIREVEALIKERPMIFTFLTKLLWPARRRILVTAKKHANIERIIGNDLFLSHSRFN